MQTNIIAILGLLKSNNVYGEVLTSADSATSTFSQCKMAYRDAFFKQVLYFTFGLAWLNKIISLEICIRYILAAHM